MNNIASLLFALLKFSALFVGLIFSFIGILQYAKKREYGLMTLMIFVLMFCILIILIELHSYGLKPT
jgi:hypothetical protein